jgi:hypothetical protein
MALSDIVQKFKKQSRLFHNRGQAVVEYVLLLVVTVSILLALIYQIFRPFQSFVKAYMGDYVSCLLETGELPGLGNKDSEALLADEGCDSKFDAATLASGRPSKYDPQSSNSTIKSDPSKYESSGSGKGSSGGEGGGSPSNSSSSGNNLLISSMKKKTATEAGGGGNEKVTEIPIENGSKFYNRKDSYSQDYSTKDGKHTYVPFIGLSEEEKKKKERQENARRTVASGENFSGAMKKTAVKPPQPKPPKAEDDEPITFGNFFRFLLIAAIIIAIVVVLGGQMLQISKSQEK